MCTLDDGRHALQAALAAAHSITVGQAVRVADAPSVPAPSDVTGGGAVSASAELSVLLPTDSFETVEKILACLRAQPRAGRLEIVLVAPTGAGLEDGDARVHGFAGVRVIEVADVAALPAGAGPGAAGRERAAGAVRRDARVPERRVPRQARGGACRALARGGAGDRQREPGQPDELGLAPDGLRPLGRGRRRAARSRTCPGHNSVYKRDLLLALDDLDELMTADTIMHAELRARGHELYLEPAARVDHLNVSQLRWALVERFESGRTFAGMRSRGWALPHRLAYALGSPLIPLVRFRRIRLSLRRCRDAPSMLRLGPALALALGVSAFGEFVGYLLGRGKTDHLYDMELHKVRYVLRRERAVEDDKSLWPR